LSLELTILGMYSSVSAMPFSSYANVALSFIELLTEAGFYREKEINFPHKKSAVMKLKREAWEGLGPVEKVSE
jgi:hypothetical protein